jgi:hypothetical protein
MKKQDDSGDFVYRYLIIDVPSTCRRPISLSRLPDEFTGSRARNPARIFVERADGVRENVSVMRWDVT